MNKIQIKLLLGLALSGLVLTSCQKTEDESVEYISRDGFYTAPRSVYFHFASADDRIIRESYGTRPDALTEFTVNIPVRHTGTASSSPLAYRVRVDEAASTARVGQHIKALAEQYTFAADSLNGTFPVTFIRSALQTEEGKADTLVLVLEATSDLRTAFSELNRITVTASNGLMITRDFWVNSSYQYFCGDFSLKKYRAILARYNQDEMALYDAFSHIGNVEIFYQLLVNIEAALIEIGEAIPDPTARVLQQFRQ